MTREDDRADADLLAAVAREPEAFAVFYARYSEAVFAYFFNRVQRSEIAADLTAETFASALAGAGRHQPTGPDGRALAVRHRTPQDDRQLQARPR